MIETKQRLMNGEAKLVEATVLLVVPSHITLEAVERNVKEGVLFIIEEHQFFEEADNYDGDNVVDDVTLLKITSGDANITGLE